MEKHFIIRVLLSIIKCSISFLETSKVDYVLFEAAGLLKDGLIREWPSLSQDEVKGLRSYLLSYVINHPTLSSYIRERIVQVVAIVIKRKSVDDLGEDRRQVSRITKSLVPIKGSFFSKSFMKIYTLRIFHQFFPLTF